MAMANASLKSWQEMPRPAPSRAKRVSGKGTPNRNRTDSSFEQIKQLYMAGQNTPRIARELGNRADIRTIIRSYATHGYIEELRGELYALLGSAVEAIRYALEIKRDHKLALRLLTDLGVLNRPRV